MKKIIAAGLVIKKDNKLLLSHDGKDDFFKIPGGKPEGNETLEECAIRELKEETNLDGIVLEKLPTMKLEKKPQTGETIDIYLYHFKGKLKNENINTNYFNHNNHKVEWIDLEDIKQNKIKVAPNLKFLLDKNELK